MTEPNELDTTSVKKDLRSRLVDAAEEWIYRLNEKEHWIFKIYDWGNEIFASLFMRGVRRHAAEVDAMVQTGGATPARIRFLTPADDEVFAELMASVRTAKYTPPHPMDVKASARALRRRSYLPFGVFIEERMVGYLLLRLFFPWRVVTGIWTLPGTHNRGLGQACLHETGNFSRSQGLADYATIAIDNPNSVRMANAAGWQTIRTNRRFHVLKLE